MHQEIYRTVVYKFSSTTRVERDALFRSVGRWRTAALHPRSARAQTMWRKHGPMTESAHARPHGSCRLHHPGHVA